VRCRLPFLKLYAMNENKFLKDFFTKKYADSIGDTNFYIAFEDCGFHISKESFNDDISKQYSKNVEIEQLSHDCDYALPIDDTILGHSSTISGSIELLRDTIKFNDKLISGDLEALLAVFGNAKTKLSGLLVSSASTVDGRSSYYRCDLNPDSFLDDTDGSIWTPYTENWSFPSTPQPTDNPGSTWKIRPDLLLNLRILSKSEAPPPTEPEPNTKPHPDSGIFNKGGWLSHVVNTTAGVAGIAAIEDVATTVVQPLLIKTPLNGIRANNFLTANNLNIEDIAALGPNNPIVKTLLSANLAHRDIMVQRFMVSNGSGNKQDSPVKTSTVNISFKYCIVNILRPWLYKNILDISKTWYCTGLTEGFFSTGVPTSDNNGKLPSLPVSMIMIKDLSISATFNAGDWEKAKSAVALDSLNIAEADFKDLGNNNHMIESKGVQIIGWICEYLPKFPVISDPNLSSN
jgi:hypothetical protein